MFKEKYLDVPLYPRRAEGILSSDFKELAVLEVRFDSVKVHWNLNLCKKHSIDWKPLEFVETYWSIFGIHWILLESIGNQ